MGKMASLYWDGHNGSDPVINSDSFLTHYDASAVNNNNQYHDMDRFDEISGLTKFTAINSSVC